MPARLTAGVRRRARLPLEWGCAKRTRPGAAACGDAEAVKEFSGGLLLGAIDGLGQGEEAAVAAESAVRVLTRYGRQPLVGLVKRCHRTLMMTRGAALSLAVFRKENNQSLGLAWLGVGNVNGLLLRSDAGAKPAQEHLPLHGGVVGYYLPAVRETVRSFYPGDTLILTTDGIRNGFEAALDLHRPVAELAEEILKGHFRGTDDALVVVARFVEVEAAAADHEVLEERPRRHQPLAPPEAGTARQVRLRRRGRSAGGPSAALAVRAHPLTGPGARPSPGAAMSIRAKAPREGRTLGPAGVAAAEDGRAPGAGRGYARTRPTAATSAAARATWEREP